jgi:hypothetical protein
MDSMTRVNKSEVDGAMMTETSRARSDSLTNIPTVEKMRPRRSTDIIEPVARTSTSSSSGFDVQSVYEAFVCSLREADNPKSFIGTQDYINGYRELLK